jgi:hypothetical protein
MNRTCWSTNEDERIRLELPQAEEGLMLRWLQQRTLGKSDALKNLNFPQSQTRFDPLSLTKMVEKTQAMQHII